VVTRGRPRSVLCERCCRRRWGGWVAGGRRQDGRAPGCTQYPSKGGVPPQLRDGWCKRDPRALVVAFAERPAGAAYGLWSVVATAVAVSVATRVRPTTVGPTARPRRARLGQQPFCTVAFSCIMHGGSPPITRSHCFITRRQLRRAARSGHSLAAARQRCPVGRPAGRALPCRRPSPFAQPCVLPSARRSNAARRISAPSPGRVPTSRLDPTVSPD
jgi:hypothetical protein